MTYKPYVQFARENRSRELKLRAEAKKERLQKEAGEMAVPKIAVATK